MHNCEGDDHEDNEDEDDKDTHFEIESVENDKDYVPDSSDEDGDEDGDEDYESNAFTHIKKEEQRLKKTTSNR